MTTNGRRRYRLTALAALLLAGVLAGCGGGNGEADSAGQSTVRAGSVPTATAAQPAEIEFAPELQGVEAWYNGGPATLAELRGQPVLLVFWADF
jgi:ABC-type glycerol-3-phosphate transport system substrate-binding protein